MPIVCMPIVRPPFKGYRNLHIYIDSNPYAWFTPYVHAHTQAHAQILFNAFLPKHSHRVGTLNAHNQIKRYLGVSQRERSVCITFTFPSQSRSKHCRGSLFFLILSIMSKIYKNYRCRWSQQCSLLLCTYMHKQEQKQ